MDKSLKKKLKKIEIKSQAELVSLLIEIIALKIGVCPETIAKWLKELIPGVEPAESSFDAQTVQEFAVMDMSQFVSVADRFMHDAKRTETGSYYTPLKWVRYMTMVSLCTYFQTVLELKEEVARELVLTAVGTGERVHSDPEATAEESLSLELIRRADESLNEVSVIDIACGAGAFLLDMIDVILKARQSFRKRLGAESDPYEDAANLCRNQVFGVDLQSTPLAVYVLCLMWRYATPENWRLEPGIYCSDSLGECVYKENLMLSDVLKRGGFDIVVGNPPYLGEKGNTELFHTIRATEFGQRHYEGKMDLSYFFTHKAIDLLRPGGHMIYLTTNYFITADGAAGLRARLSETTDFVHILNMNDYPVFRDALGQHNMIFAARKHSSNEQYIQTGIVYVDGLAQRDRIEIDPVRIFKSEADPKYISAYSCPSSELFRKNGTIAIMSDRAHKGALDSYETFCDIKLKDIFDVNQGIVSGADQVSRAMLHNKLSQNVIDAYDMKRGDPIYVIDAEHAAARTLEPEVLRPFYKNSDIADFVIKPRTRRVIIYLGQELDDVFTQYPKTAEHLEAYREVLEGRREVLSGTRPWYCLQWPRKASVFEGRKIVVPQRSRVNRFAYTDEPFYASADVYYLKARDDQMELSEWYYYLGVLNASVMYLWLYHYGKRKGELLELYSKPLMEVVLPKFRGFEWQLLIAESVRGIVENLCGDSENMYDAVLRIDQILFDNIGIDLHEQKNIRAARNRG